MCRDHGPGRDSSLEVTYGPRDTRPVAPGSNPPGVYLGGFQPGGNSLDPAGQALQRVGEVHFAMLGRFLELATARGAKVAGIDAAGAMVELAAERMPEADLRVGDLEGLPSGDGSFDVVTGFSSFQFADDKARALAEARRVAQRQVVVVIPTRVPEAASTRAFQPLFPLFPA